MLVLVMAGAIPLAPMFDDERLTAVGADADLRYVRQPSPFCQPQVHDYVESDLNQIGRQRLSPSIDGTCGEPSIWGDQGWGEQWCRGRLLHRRFRRHRQPDSVHQEMQRPTGAGRRSAKPPKVHERLAEVGLQQCVPPVSLLVCLKMLRHPRILAPTGRRCTVENFDNVIQISCPLCTELCTSAQAFPCAHTDADACASCLVSFAGPSPRVTRGPVGNTCLRRVYSCIIGENSIERFYKPQL